ncbi:FkbM family methyltransferase [Pseudotabrizicola sp. L79]|uniref:FkbM family methyltransferase n=1 Tax=Pseudotabrizicola sp. L79 TaxID=3118402 RepID=UPI002F9371F2
MIENLPFDAPSADMTELSGKLDLMLKLMEEQLMLQRIGLLDAGHVLRFAHGGNQEISLSLPNAQDDYVQRMILKTRSFYEGRLLATIQGMKLIDATTTVCDIGANIGNHSVFFGKVLGAKQLLAFEPQANVYATLCRNLELNGLTDALAYNCLVGAKSGRGDVARFNPRNLGSTAYTPAKDGAVPMVALDDLMDGDEMKSLGFIKIDADGMQLDVLQGAKKILKAKKPALWLEMMPRDPVSGEIVKFLEGFGYSAVQIGPNDQVFTARK